MTRLQALSFIAGCLCLAGALSSQGSLRAQTPPTTIRSETRLVVVDTVVTDKKGKYIEDLKQQNFRVFEDGKEVQLNSFSFEADSAAQGKSQPRYIVLFFDNSTMDLALQTQAHEAAAKFIDTNAGPNRLMAVVNYGGSLIISQNFTANAERLKKAVSGVKFSYTSPVADDSAAAVSVMGNSALNNAAAQFGARNVLMGLQSLAKNLGQVPGRKSLILLTAGFPLTPDSMSDLTALINVCNKSNVAVYPIDVRGLVAPSGSLYGPAVRDGDDTVAEARPASRSVFRLASFVRTAATAAVGEPAMAFGWAPPAGPPSSGGGGRVGGGGGAPPPSAPPPSTGGGRGGGGGGNTGNTGNTGGRGAPNVGTPGHSGSGNTGNAGRGGGSYFNPNNPIYNNPTNPMNQSRQILPRFPESATNNQQLMYALALGTGGFVIANTNDLLGGFEKIGREQNEFYLLGYTPPESEEGSCHTIQVKIVDRGGTSVRSRSGYCNVRPRDLLAGSSVEKGLEAIATGSSAGPVNAAMLAPYFYTANNVARVNVAMEIPTEKVKFEKEKGKFNSSLHVLGLVTKADGTVAARFSDTVKLRLENKKAVEEFKEKPLHYEGQFDVASGDYTLKVAFSSSGDNFGRVESPLSIAPYKDTDFSISGVALGTSFVKIADMDSGMDAAMIEDRKVLISRGIQIIPTGSTKIKKTDKPLLYVEIYEPGLRASDSVMVGLQLRIVDRKTGQALDDTGLMNLAALMKPGNPVIPVGMGLPLDKLVPGQYRAEVQARDSAGHKTTLRATEFDLQ